MAGDSPLQRGTFLRCSGIEGGWVGDGRDRSHSSASKAGPTSVATGSTTNGRVQGKKGLWINLCPATLSLIAAIRT